MKEGKIDRYRRETEGGEGQARGERGESGREEGGRKLQQMLLYAILIFSVFVISFLLKTWFCDGSSTNVDEH